MILSIFSRTYLQSLFCQFFKLICVFFFLLLSLHILSSSLKLLFILLAACFRGKKVIILMESNLPISSFMCHAFHIIAKRVSVSQRLLSYVFY